MTEHRNAPAQGAIRPRDDVRAMFGRIVPNYDLMNRLMTGGRDVSWRRIVVREAVAGRVPAALDVLDVATGTGDLALALRAAGVARVSGLDFSGAMLNAAASKEASSGSKGIAWVEGDAMALPFPDASFAAVTVGFGLRNMPDYAGALREMTRVLASGGKLVCLEMTPVQTPLLREVFSWGFARVLPAIGGLISGDAEAYAYLPASAAVFPDAQSLGRMMRDAGLWPVRYRLLGMGSVGLHVGTKPPRKANEGAGDRLAIVDRDEASPR